MKYVIWGAGARGLRVYSQLRESDVAAFIDNDEKKQGTWYGGKQVISFSEYEKAYSECYIIISNLQENEVVKRLKENHIGRYFLLSECPGEFQEPFSRDLLKKYICEYVKKDMAYTIYGCTLYAVELCRWLEEELGRQIHVIPHKELDEESLSDLREEFLKGREVSPKELPQNVNEEILVTVEGDVDALISYFGETIRLTNVYDWSSRIAEYYNPRLERYKNLHEGKRCFVIGTGPSLKVEDLETLHDNGELCFSMNNIFRSFADTSWRPDYYVITDYEFLLEGEVLKNVPDSTKFVSDCCKPFWEKNQDDSVLRFHTQYESYRNRRPKFSENFAQRSYLGYTVAYTCLQLAVYMGFSEIYLLGIDCSYLKGGKENYFYQQDEKDNLDHGTDYMVLAYESARAYADSHGIEIYNATRGGMLEVFERVDFDSLFK